MDNRVSLQNKRILLNQIEWEIQYEIARGSSVLAYKVFHENYGTAILKEYYPIELDLIREEERLVCEDENSWKQAKYLFTKKMKSFIDTIKLNLVDQMVYNNLPSTLFYEDTNNTVYILQNYAYGSLYSEMKEKSLLELFENMLSIANIIKDFHKMGYILFDVKPSNLYVVLAADQHYFNLIDFDSITHKEHLQEDVLIKCSHDYHDSTPLENINEKYDIYSIGAMIKERIKDFDFNQVHVKVKKLVDELIENTCCSQDKRYDDQALIQKLLEIVEYLHIKYTLSSMTLHQQMFFGYQKELSNIQKELQKQGYACLFGLEGVGKESLAYEYAYLHQDEYDIIQILDFDSDWLETFKHLQLNQAVENINDSFVFSLLNQCDHSLFIINHYSFNDSNNEFFKLLRKTKAHFITTSISLGTICIHGLDKESAYLLFMEKYQKEIKRNEIDVIYQLLSDLNYHPGMIELCALAARQINGSLFQSPIKSFINHLHLEDVYQINHHIDSFQHHIQKILDLQQFSEAEKEVVYVLYFADYLGISEKFLIDYGIDSRCLFTLENRSIIQRNHGIVKLNSMFQNDMIRKSMNLSPYVSEHLLNRLALSNEANMKCMLICKMSIIDPLFQKVLHVFLKKNVLIYASSIALENLNHYLKEIQKDVTIPDFSFIDEELLKRKGKADELVERIKNGINTNDLSFLGIERINLLRSQAKKSMLQGDLTKSITYYLQADKYLCFYPYGYVDIIQDSFSIAESCSILEANEQASFYINKAFEILSHEDKDNIQLRFQCLLNVISIYRIMGKNLEAIEKLILASRLDGLSKDNYMTFLSDLCIYLGTLITLTKFDDEHMKTECASLVMKIINLKEKLELQEPLSDIDYYAIHLDYIIALQAVGDISAALDYLNQLKKQATLNHITLPSDLRLVHTELLRNIINSVQDEVLPKMELLEHIALMERYLQVENRLGYREFMISDLAETYAYLLFHYKECNTSAIRNKAISYLKQSIAYDTKLNVSHYVKSIQHKLYLLNNLGEDFTPLFASLHHKKAMPSTFSTIYDLVNNRLDELAKELL